MNFHLTSVSIGGRGWGAGGLEITDEFSFDLGINSGGEGGGGGRGLRNQR